MHYFKSVNFYRQIFLLFTLSILMILQSCSWLTNRQSLFGDDKKEVAKKTKTASGPVTREEYNELQARYKKLQEELAIRENGQMSDVNNQSLLKELKNANDSDLAETVDVFPVNRTSRRSAPSAPSNIDYSKLNVEGSINTIRKGIMHVNRNELDQALKVLRPLEGSPIRQIRVRSKYYIGEIMFRQGDYDLAMQIFEEILKKDAFSGVVIKSLGKLIVCSEKLKMAKKQEKYYSILHDFFES